jgi:hypothetical protein
MLPLSLFLFFLPMSPLPLLPVPFPVPYLPTFPLSFCPPFPSIPCSFSQALYLLSLTLVPVAFPPVPFTRSCAFPSCPIPLPIPYDRCPLFFWSTLLSPVPCPVPHRSVSYPVPYAPVPCPLPCALPSYSLSTFMCHIPSPQAPFLCLVS